MEELRISRITKLVHTLLSHKLKKGDTVVDATMGNGHDTIFLAEAVGAAGKVYAFDLQEVALVNTELSLKKKGIYNENIFLIKDSHSNIDKYLKEPISCGMFNLGYMPGGDHSVVTKGETTITALRKTLELLKPNGILSVILYYGHEGGEDEKATVLSYLSSLDISQFTVLQWSYMNSDKCPPIILLIEKK
ncbi:tRNA (mnm(5)s(2)U34)-methyltransferase [Alkaliphilus serpentinus]|uniref:SAM-dependent methyltransferase n=1 Tax=Alkaliphilus serpentinus TaxID=1482731 RepID=A0A833HL89_9FIRM|nr:class I SAM-dependent methyltransferase [Alkaliphilus serpentinus]KAB3524961.1 SAM-dependent methyltransferase [Alkaliphilus serpentinus]